ncbi:MAG: FixH family protein [Bdellovibrionales bacterium]|nr:FixH family protein [Bdellovibrionales bacterium]
MTERGAFNWPIAIFSFFAMVFAANGILVYFAVNNPHQLAEEQPYQKGLEHQAVIDQEQAVQDLGLSSTITFVPTQGGRLAVVKISRNQTEPVAVENAVLEMKSPVDGSSDERAVMSSSADSDELTAMMRLPRKGLWLAALSFKYEGKQLLIRRRVFLDN